MKRLFLGLLLVLPCGGCMMVEDLLGFDDSPQRPFHVATAEPLRGTCGQDVRPAGGVQTTEPELFRR